MKRGVSRISVSIPVELRDEFDEAVRCMDFGDRSKAIQMAMQNLITEYTWSEKEEGAGVGAVMTIYDHEVIGIGETLTDIQHRYKEVINSTTYIHLDEINCLEIIAVKGDSQRVKALSRELMTRRGIKQVKMTVM